MNSHLIEYIAPQLVKPRIRAWRKYPAEQIREAKRQIERCGRIVEPPLIDSDNTVVCGGAIVRAAQELNWQSIPVLRIDGMTPEELRLYAINAHKLSDMGGYVGELLAEELRELEKLLGADILSSLAIAEGELTQLLGIAGPTPAENEAADPSDVRAKPIAQLGEMYLIGQHRLLCDSSLDEHSFPTLMADELAQFVLTDPPYNLPQRLISGDPDREEFAFGHGEMSTHEYTRFLTTVMRHMKQWSEPGSLHAIFMSYHYLLELLRAGTIVYGRPKAMCTWVKGQGGQGGLFRSQTEQIVYFRNGDAPHRNYVMLGRYGRNRTTAWHYDGMTTATTENRELLQSHSTPKPVLLLKDAILDVTTRGGIVLDPFAGIGGVLLAAHSAERRAYAIEIEPRYVDIAIRRMRSTYQIEAVRASDGVSFSELEAQQKELGRDGCA